MSISKYEKTVRRTASFYSNLGVPYKDLVQEGWVGLIKDSTAGHNAYLCIKHAIVRALSNNATTVRLPEYLIARIIKINMGETEGLSPIQIKRAMMACGHTISFDKKTDGLSLHEIICNRHEPYDPAPDRIYDALTILDEKERLVIEMNFGLNGYKKTSLEVIGLSLGKSKSMASVIKQQALKKLRAQFEQNL